MNSRQHSHQAAAPTAAPKPAGPLTSGPLPRKSDAVPMAVRAITKLDPRSMVWADEGIATQMESMGPFIALWMIVAVYVMGWFLIHGFSDLIDEGIGTAIAISAAGIFGIICAIGIAIYSLKVSLFNVYADLHFNRKAGKIYTALNKKPFVMDWQHVHPMAQLTVGPLQLGAPPLMSLVLVETAPNNPKVWVRKLTVAGPLPNRDACQQVWELIRLYMEEEPEDLPPQSVTPNSRSWETVLVAFGPLAQEQMPGEYMKQLRANNWHVQFTGASLFIWLLFWVDPISNLLYTKYRRRAKLPPDLVAQEAVPSGKANPYRTSAADPAEAAGMRHAARVIGTVLAITTIISMIIWALFLVPLTMMFLQLKG